MVLDKIFGGISNINPKYWQSDFEGQGFDRSSAVKLSSVVQRKNLAIWGAFAAGVLAFPLSSRARVIVLQRYNTLSKHFVSPSFFNFLLASCKIYLLGYMHYINYEFAGFS